MQHAAERVERPGEAKRRSTEKNLTISFSCLWGHSIMATYAYLAAFLNLDLTPASVIFNYKSDAWKGSL